MVTRKNYFKTKLFNKKSSYEVHGLAYLFTHAAKQDLPLPGKFVLGIDIGQEGEEETSTIDIEVLRPEFGSKKCDADPDWYGDLNTKDGVFSREDADAFQEVICINKHEFSAPGYKFTTTSSDRNLLPNNLAQAKENYHIIFRDEFSDEGGLEKLDDRLWVIKKGNPCNNIRIEDGSLVLNSHIDCVTAKGSVFPVSINPRLNFKYGYLEGRLSKVVTGNSNGYSNMGWNSYGGGGGQFKRNHRSVMDFVCRGNNRLAMRKRWMNMFGTEMQFLEMFNSWGSYSSAWVVFHSMESQNAQRCYDGRIEIYSGVHWNTVRLREDDSYTFAIEWTPSGYRIFINGTLHNHSSVNEYGYSLNSPSGIYVYRTSSFSQNPIPRTVSHIPQGFNLFVKPISVTKAADLPEGWSEEVRLDYIRVYQPRDKYATETKTYD